MPMDVTFLSDASSVRYVEDTLAALAHTPCHFHCGLLMVCTEGRGIISTGVQQYEMCAQTELILLDGSLIQLADASPDFRVRLLVFPKEVLLKAVLPIDTEYLDFLHHVPFFDHKAHEQLPDSWTNINLWLDMARLLFAAEKPVRYGGQLEQNYLQSLLMWISNTIPPRFLSLAADYGRRQVLCHQFMHLVHEHSIQEHRVAFYADRLYITPRYLNEVVRTCCKGKTPKHFINEQLTAEIKVLLNEPHLSVSEIARRVNFQEPTYFSRFFKRATGMSPQAYRDGLSAFENGQEHLAKDA